MIKGVGNMCELIFGIIVRMSQLEKANSYFPLQSTEGTQVT